MRMQAPKPCRHPACNAYAFDNGFCEKHKKQKQQLSDAQRGTSTQRGYGYKWQKESKRYLRANPLCECEQCQAGKIQVTQAVLVDHITPHRLKEANDSKDPARIKAANKLMWDRKNWQSMSKLHHDKKTATENGGFGR